MPNPPNPRFDEYVAMQNTTPTTPTPEPTIGPGMILERGRERVVVLRPCYGDWTVVKFHRSLWRSWPVTGQQFVAETAHIRYLLLSGFRVVREGSK